MPDKDNDSLVASGTLISKIDAGDPLHLHPSDSANLTIANIKLKGTDNYNVWANAMNLALQVKNKLGFIDGSCARSTTDEVLGKQWDRCNSIVLTWILNSVSEELYLGHVYSKLASVVWKELKETYDKVDGSVVFNLYQKTNSFSQNGMPVSEYYHKLNCMWKQLDQILSLPTCTCDASKQFNDFNHLIKLMQFLMGLDSVYQSVRTSLLTREVLPSVKEAFSVVSREESHRNSNNFSKKISNNPVGFAVKTSQSFDSKRKNVRPPNPNLKCSHCNKTGHTVERCYELVGYPSWMKSKTSGNKGGMVSNNVVVDTPETASSSTVNGLTNEQIAQLLSLLNNKSIGETQGSNFAGRSNYVCFNSYTDGVKPTCDFKPAYCFSNFGNNGKKAGCIIDSGANQHMITDDTNLINQMDVTEYNIKVKHPNGTSALVTKIGDVKLSDKVILYDVFLIPDYCVNLVSVHKLAKDCNLTVSFDEHNCYIQDTQTEKVLVTGSQLDGLYFCGSSTMSNKVCNASLDANLWHARLGHPAEPVLHVLKDKLDIKKDTKIEPCETCHRAKQHREPFPLSDHKTKSLGDLVHLDVWGPYKVQSRDGSRYFLTVVDDYTRAVWVYLMKNKDEVLYNIKGFFNMLKIQFSKHIKMFRSDNGTEFINKQMKEFCYNNGIIHQTSCVHTPQQNGIVERKHRHLLNVARALLFQAGFPLKFWSGCILTATYLINRTPSSVLNGRSPYELVFGFPPMMSQLRIVGCLCFSTVLNNSDKFNSHAEKCVLVGYSNEKKGYKLWSLDQRVMFYSRDVRFYESVFPFKEKKTSLDPDSEVNTLNSFDLFDQNDTQNSKSDSTPNDDNTSINPTVLNHS
ncbi:putative RNA-directed DNA polymerase [Helianthus annuus]|nr:putative RNA-directed DNA polymerase [Helianthus annuus]